MNWFAKIACALGTRLTVLLLTLMPVLLLWPNSPLAQAPNAAAVSLGPIMTSYGTIAAGAPYYVCSFSSIGVPCSTAGVSLYSDANLTQSLPNPGSTNTQGILSFFVAAGDYQIQVTPTPSDNPYVYYAFLASGGAVYPGANTIAVANSGNTAWRTPLWSDITALSGYAPYTLPSTVVQTNQANTYEAYLQDFSAGIVKVSIINTDPGALIGNYALGNYPEGTAVDSVGNVWILNHSDQTIMKYTPSGTLVATYSTAVAGQSGAAYLTIDQNDNLWFGIHYSSGITEMSPSGVIQKTCVTGQSGTYPGPFQLVTDVNNNIWMVVGNTVAMGTGVLVELPNSCTNVSSPLQTIALPGEFPEALSFDSGGNVWVAYGGSAQMTEVSPAGSIIQTISISAKVQSNNNGQFIFDLSGNIWIANGAAGSNNTIYVLSPSGATLQSIVLSYIPAGLAKDPLGNVWVTGYNSGSTATYISEISPGGQVLNTYTSGGGSIFSPVINRDGTVWATVHPNSGLGYVLRLAGSTVTGLPTPLVANQQVAQAFTQQPNAFTKDNAFGNAAAVDTLPSDLGNGAIIPSSTAAIVYTTSTAASGVNGLLAETDWSPNVVSTGKYPLAFGSDLEMDLDGSSGSFPTILGAQITITNNSNTTVAPETEGLLVNINNVGNANINGANVLEAGYINYGTSTNGATSLKGSLQIPNGGGQMPNWYAFRMLAPVLGGSNGVTKAVGYGIPVCQIAGVTTCNPIESLETTGPAYFAGPVIVNGLKTGTETGSTTIIPATTTSYTGTGNVVLAASPSLSGVVSASAATATLTYAGGQDGAAGSSTLGGASVRGANNLGATGAGTAGGALLNGGSNASATTSSQSGSTEVEPGFSTAGGQQGVSIYGQVYQEGSGSFTQWNLVCSDASTRQTVDACGATPSNVVGVMDSHNGSYIEVHTPPSLTPINASATVTLGHSVCAGATAGNVTDSGGTGPCPSGSGLTIGVVAAVSGQYTFADGSTAAISTTLPLIQMWKVNAVGGGDVVGTLSNGTTGNAATATTATNATNVAATTQSGNTTYYLAFLAANSTSNQGVNVGPATYNPSTGVITATNFTGAVTGTASANAGTGSCTNQVVTAENAHAAPTCTTITSAYVDSSIALTGGAWSQTTPSPSSQGGSLGSGNSTIVRVQTIGKSAFMNMQVFLGGSGAGTGTGALKVAMPFTVQNSNGVAVSCMNINTGVIITGAIISNTLYMYSATGTTVIANSLTVVCDGVAETQ